jgi:transitional endoplasmic reticulum ATPase
MKKKSEENTLLNPGDIFRETYEVDCFVGSGAFAEVYRVKHKFLGLQAVKVLKPESIKDRSVSSIISEAVILSNLTHPNIVRVFEANTFKRDDREIVFISMEYVSGESLFQLLRRKIRIGIPLALSIQRDICAGLSFAHRQNPPIIHRDVKPQNIMLSYDTTNPTAKVSDFGLAKAVDPKTRMSGSAGTLAYLAPEGFWNYHLPASDVFSAGIILYQMITGVTPWNYDFSAAEGDLRMMETAIIKARKKEPVKPSKFNDLCDKDLDEIILTAIKTDSVSRFKDATEFLNALIGFENRESREVALPKRGTAAKPSDSIERAKGFDGVAGMDNLKELLYSEIILPLQQKELFNKYRVPFPNGILLYGPPGCGKTFVSRKLAEEVNYNFIEVKPSDLASIYVHGSQEKIGKLFREAREKAPTLLFIDEIDALIPKRTDRLDHHYSSEVNEFLSQISDCSRDGIILVAATNRPDRIDPAALRTGRMDKLIFVPPPDFNARTALFKLFLKGRPSSSDIDYDALASSTENYVASDIEAIVNDAARRALKERSNISMQHFVDSTNSNPPSVSKAMIDEYKDFVNT